MTEYFEGVALPNTQVTPASDIAAPVITDEHPAVADPAMNNLPMSAVRKALFGE